ncbi:hypothetical protein [uncultured Enterococcus sp.]|uniref:hypothetical protein n=1 Tax=uncultured Enterococcus sp. TaxID=167972 RepID=UPI002AA7E7AB|nr:hypothetical protein [uncultured Enterococcus sp.]
MGIYYLICHECEEPFPDVIDYRICPKCKNDLCGSCSDELIKKYGDCKDVEFLEDYGYEFDKDENESDCPCTCSKCAGDAADDTIRVDYLCNKYMITRESIDAEMKIN